MLTLRSFSFQPFDVPLIEPFGIAGGAQLRANNVLIQLVLGDGTTGIGEAAPFFDVSGETQEAVLQRLGAVEEVLRNRDLSEYRAVSSDLHELFRGVPSALCGVEVALFDALCRSAGIAMRSFFGGAEVRLTTDVTIVTGDAAHAAESASRWLARGFTRFKVKVGGDEIDEDVRRLLAIHRVAPAAELVLDANASMSADAALTFLRELKHVAAQVILFEQPTPAEDWDGLRKVERDSGIPVAADESLRSREDFRRITEAPGISAINIKTAKLGLVAAYDLLVAARAHGMHVMVGGMVESELSMSASASLAAGVGGVRFVDLDTPLFMGPRPLSGGYDQEGPLLDLSRIRLGHGVTWLSQSIRDS